MSDGQGRPKRLRRTVRPQAIDQANTLCLVCSHCGQSMSSDAFNRSHYYQWDHQRSRWLNTINNMPEKPKSDSLRGDTMHAMFEASMGVPIPVMRAVNDRDLDQHDDPEMVEVIDDGGDNYNELLHGPEVADEENKRAPAPGPMEKKSPSEVAPEPMEKKSPPNQAPQPTVLPKGTGFLYGLKMWAALYRVPQMAVTLLLLLLVAFVPSLLAVLPQAGATIKNTDLDSLCGVSYLQDDFQKLCVCPDCYFVRPLSECYAIQTVEHGKIVHIPKTCDNRKTPGSPLCNAELCKLDPKGRAVPLSLVFPYLSAATQINEILSRPENIVLVDHWKNRKLQGFHADVYEGAVWEDFQTDDQGRDFLKTNGLGLLLNTDGFQVSTTLNYSVVGVYLAIFNLPAEVRYLRKNMVLVGLVPGGKEKIGLQSFMKPLVDELLVMWEPNNSLLEGRRAAVLCIAADMPATMKMTGTASHGHNRYGPRVVAQYGLRANSNSTCYGSNQRPFDQPWPARTRNSWLADIEKFDNARQSQRAGIYKATGVASSELARLPYMQPRFFTVDPMHNLWEGVINKHLWNLIQLTKEVPIPPPPKKRANANPSPAKTMCRWTSVKTTKFRRCPPPPTLPKNPNAKPRLNKATSRRMSLKTTKV
jgi:hypothetical protein